MAPGLQTQTQVSDQLPLDPSSPTLGDPENRSAPLDSVYGWMNVYVCMYACMYVCMYIELNAYIDEFYKVSEANKPTSSNSCKNWKGENSPKFTLCHKHHSAFKARQGQLKEKVLIVISISPDSFLTCNPWIKYWREIPFCRWEDSALKKYHQYL